MELGLVVVVLQAQLDKVPASLRTLPREELDLDVADARLQTNFAGGRRLVDVDLAHFHTTWSSNLGPEYLTATSSDKRRELLSIRNEIDSQLKICQI